MSRVSGTFMTSVTYGETVSAFVPYALPPSEPPLAAAIYQDLNRDAELALARLAASGLFITGCCTALSARRPC